MATSRQSTKTSGASRPGVQEQAERLSKSLGESAQQVWLAGVGAFGRAQTEGTRLFEALVKEGQTLEQHARKFAGGRAEVVRDAVEVQVGHARERAADSWDRLEKVFDDRVHRALVKLGVPGRDDIADLSRQVQALTAELRRQGNSTVAPKPAGRKSPARKTTTAARKTAGKPAKKPAVKPPTAKRPPKGNA